MEAFSLLKYWRAAGGGNTTTSSSAAATILTAASPSSSSSSSDSGNDDADFTIGPLHKYFPASSSSLIEQDRSAIKWLDKQPAKSVIYVSFGSIAEMDKAQLAEVAWGIANSCHPFLWVVRPGSVQNSSGLENLPEGFSAAVESRGYMVNWAAAGGSGTSGGGRFLDAFRLEFDTGEYLRGSSDDVLGTETQRTETFFFPMNRELRPSQFQ